MSAHRQHDQDGFVMIITIVVMAFALVLAGVAVTNAMQGRELSKKDLRGKRAQQAADAAVNTALFRLNEAKLANANYSGGLAALSQTVACQPLLTLSAAISLGFTDVGAASGNCSNGKSIPGKAPAFKDVPLGDGTTMSAYITINPALISSGNTNATHGVGQIAPVIVGVGRDQNGTPNDTSDDTIRRVRVTLKSYAPFNALEASGNLTFNTAGLVTATTLNGSAIANGNVSFSGGLLSTFANTDLSVAPLSVTGSVVYHGTQAAQGGIVVNLTTFDQTTDKPDNRTPVTIASTKPDCPSTGCPSQYKASDHSLVASSGTVTLPGGDYVFCNVQLTGSATIRPVPSGGTPVRIFVDHPKSARCAGTGVGGNDLTITGRLDPGVNVQPSQLQIYSAGPPTGISAPQTVATFDTTNANLSLLPGFFYYGPSTNVTLKYSTFQGNIIGQDVTLTAAGVLGTGLNAVGVGTFTQDLNVNNLALSPSLGTFSASEYGECTGRDVTNLAASANNC